MRVTASTNKIHKIALESYYNASTFVLEDFYFESGQLLNCFDNPLVARQENNGDHLGP